MRIAKLINKYWDLQEEIDTELKRTLMMLQKATNKQVMFKCMSG